MARYKHFNSGKPGPLGGKDGCGNFYKKPEDVNKNPLPEKMTQLPNDEGKYDVKMVSDAEFNQLTLGDSLSGGKDGAEWAGSKR